MGIDLLAGTVYGTRAMIARPPRILVFDSGIGGLSVLREVRAAMPGAALVYAADDAGFPYGGWEEAMAAGRRGRSSPASPTSSTGSSPSTRRTAW